MNFAKKKIKTEKNKGVKRRRFREMLRSCERAYGVEVPVKNKEELSLWFVARDPYLAELFCE